ncbi:MAG TPA: nicotinate-nucleotide adenylyltransferase [Chthoniobacterales bacterium]|nr:nicotinate-nucleotide adenylyltransferase [Chthoniobacterales bacterium]
MKAKRTGIFGGTFDPIHCGHLILARDAIEQLELDHVLFIPAAASPHKLGQTHADPHRRTEMVRAAIKDEPRFCLDTMELDRPPPSFAIDTVEALHKREPATRFFYLIGEDNVARLDTWHRFQDLSSLVQFVVLDRSGSKTEHSYPTIRRQIDISASDIRNRVARGQSIRYLVPAAVHQIIREHQLYRET